MALPENEMTQPGETQSAPLYQAQLLWIRGKKDLRKDCFPVLLFLPGTVGIRTR